MTKTTASVLLWTPRLAGVALALFLSTFALDAFDGRPAVDAFADFLIHLAPALLVLVLVSLAWRMPLVGAAGFPVLAIGYAAIVRWRLDWTVAIAGPLLLLGALFFVSWRARPGGFDRLRA